jgi:hypothetical protein
MNIIRLQANHNMDETYAIIGFDNRFSGGEVEYLVKEIWHLANSSKGEGTGVDKFNRIMRKIPGITVFDSANSKSIYV